MKILILALLAFAGAQALASPRLVHGVGRYTRAWDGSPRPNADLDAGRKCSGDPLRPGPVRRVSSYEDYAIGETSFAEADYLCLNEGDQR